MSKIKVEKMAGIHMLHPGCTVLVTCSDEALDNIIAITWQSPLSTNPPTVCISVTPKRHSYNMIMESKEFGINIPNADLLNEVHYCGVRSGRDEDKFLGTGLTKVKSEIIKTPMIKECVGHVECKVVSTHPGGEHTIFVATIEAVRVEEELFDGKWKTGKGKLESLHYLGGTKYALLGETVTAKIPKT